MSGTDRMRAAAPGVKLTYDDFVLFPDDGMRHELIDGEHYVTASPNIRHQRILGKLYLSIGTWLETHRIGEVFLSPLDVVFTQFDVVEPDLLYVSNERAAEILTELHVRGVPDLVVEVASRGTRTRDETIKRQLYERMAVSEYWIVDPVTDVVRVLRREGERFGLEHELRRDAGDLLVTPLFPGLEMPLNKIFAE